VARDRQRAKQRKARRGGNPPQPIPPSQPHRDNVPGPLDHASGEVDQAEAAILRNAGEEDVNAAARDAFGRDEDDEDDPGVAVDLDDDGDVDADDERLLEQEAVSAAPAERESLARETVPGTTTRRGPGRFIGFLRASWAELQRVQWPDRRQVAQATAVVIAFVIIAGAYLGVADWVAQRIVNFVI
jgi:preprotein translocase subunit SecE